MENKISANKYAFFHMQTVLQNSKTLILVHPLKSAQEYVSIPKIDRCFNHPSYSITMLANFFISKIFTLFSMVEGLNDNTELVLQFIQKNPGCHMRHIQREMDMAMGTIQYHLNLLEEMGRIVSERSDSHRYYFPVGSFGDLERNILKILNQDSAREILLFIIERKNPTQTDITSSMRISSGTANWHLVRLLQYGIITEQKEGKFKRYQLNGKPDSVIKLLQSYHSSKWNSWSNKLAELFLSMSTPKEEDSQ
ncbi:MAG TPA: winged helix-turn-helix transcriptional regulator [Verrucomicrobiae bacterium]|nr:winged helix-turn-helix transcriptional regulator [Verrucomicrobiae bacterium]